MMSDYRNRNDPRIAHAVAELQAMMVACYPEATFAVWQGEAPIGASITATVNVPDTDAVTDLVIDRLIALQVEEALPVYVTPVRPVGRIQAARRQRGQHVHRAARVSAGPSTVTFARSGRKTVATCMQTYTDRTKNG